jgi:hypothetical protein
MRPTQGHPSGWNLSRQLRKRNTRAAYARAAEDFAWWGQHGIEALHEVKPVHVATYIEGLQQRKAAPPVKLYLTGTGMLFDWLVPAR